MSLRIGAGFRLGRHVWIGASVPLGHGRRLVAHRGHGDWFDTLVGLAIMWVFLRVCWALAWGRDRRSGRLTIQRHLATAPV
jgi:hypothetical protein